MALAAVVIASVIARKQRRGFIVTASTSIARELIASTNSTHLVRPGPELTTKLGELLSAPTRIASVRLGDVPAPFGDGKAGSTVVLTNDRGFGVAIRLGHRDGSGKFDVLGYQSLKR